MWPVQHPCLIRTVALPNISCHRYRLPRLMFHIININSALRDIESVPYRNCPLCTCNSNYSPASLLDSLRIRLGSGSHLNPNIYQPNNKRSHTYVKHTPAQDIATQCKYGSKGDNGAIVGVREMWWIENARITASGPKRTTLAPIWFLNKAESGPLGAATVYYCFIDV